jgi:hypothetical protein
MLNHSHHNPCRRQKTKMSTWLGRMAAHREGVLCVHLVLTASKVVGVDTTYMARRIADQQRTVQSTNKVVRHSQGM